MYSVEHYRTPEGRDIFQGWLDGLRDQRGKARILARIDRLEAGNLGDCEPVGEGVLELRIHFGPGYRVYVARAGEVLMLLLCGGDKGSQAADIEKAKQCLIEYKERKT